MKKTLILLLVCLAVNFTHAGNILNEGFEYGNHDLQTPVGWICDDNSWVCGYLEKDHNRLPHSGNWYAFTDGDNAWMFMPLYLIQTMRYRFSCWAVSDGSVTLEFWTGTAPNADDMHTQLLVAPISSGIYEKVSAYVETIPSGCEYIGIHCIGGDRGYLTIDDVEVDMVQQYIFEAEAITGDTVMYPGTQAIFRFLIHNTGYDPVDVTVHPSNEFFTDFSFYSNGICTTTFPTQPDEFVEVTTYATLRPEIEPGTVAWLDINMTIPCNCNTAMVTFWVTPLDPVGLPESDAVKVSVFPNPATDFVTIEAQDLQKVTLMDITGKALDSYTAKGNSIRLDISELKAGVYYILAKTDSTSSFVKPILKM